MFGSVVGPDWAWAVYAAAFAAMIAGSLWLIRIGAGDDDPDRTSWRYQGKARDSRLAWIPGAPEPPTWRWLATRAGMASAPEPSSSPSSARSS